ncbi:hypothetical protein KI387_001993, partial [Taxus chinensis]
MCRICLPVFRIACAFRGDGFFVRLLLACACGSAFVVCMCVFVVWWALRLCLDFVCVGG